MEFGATGFTHRMVELQLFQALRTPLLTLTLTPTRSALDRGPARLLLGTVPVLGEFTRSTKIGSGSGLGLGIELGAWGEPTRSTKIAEAVSGYSLPAGDFDRNHRPVDGLF